MDDYVEHAAQTASAQSRNQVAVCDSDSIAIRSLRHHCSTSALRDGAGDGKRRLVVGGGGRTCRCQYDGKPASQYLLCTRDVFDIQRPTSRYPVVGPATGYRRCRT